MTQSFQPMPELSPEQLDALRANIAAHGVLLPVVKDQHGRIIDGNHRAAIAAELGIDYPTQTIGVSDDDDAGDRAVALNCTRRHLSREQVRELIANEIRRKPGDSDRAIARRVGCSPTTVGTVRAEARSEAEGLTRRQAEELIEQLRELIHDVRGQIVMQAVILHDKGHDWQSLCDSVERMLWAELFKLDSDLAPTPEIWGPLFGVVFDALRSYDCDPDWTVCVPAQRQWRDAHPERVYRWSDPPEVSKLDTAPVGGGQ